VTLDWPINQTKNVTISSFVDTCPGVGHITTIEVSRYLYDQGLVLLSKDLHKNSRRNDYTDLDNRITKQVVYI